ncbi:MAG: AmmeMemoRadiSam system protein A [Elusimicrobia bacterium]|nr:AmmeMemoRadiSam system protein A [Elusimicrobiota bacterium]
MILSEMDKSNLLQFARKALEESAQNPDLRSGTEWTRAYYPSLPSQAQNPVAVFVTLFQREKLKGCVGTILPEHPLLEAVAKMTLQSAFCDPRFPPLSSSDLSDTRIEISILSPLRKISSVEEILPFQHGVHIRKGWNQGVFLPQVWQTLPNLETFMTELCRAKAGLPSSAWRDPETEIQVFTVESVQESEHAQS